MGKIFETTYAGKVPCKKNQWHRNRNGGIYFTGKNTETEIKNLEWFLRSERVKKAFALGNHPVSIIICFYVSRSRKDSDNMLGTVLDTLKKSSIIFDDSVKHIPAIHIKSCIGKTDTFEIFICPYNEDDEDFVIAELKRRAREKDQQ